MFTFFTGWPWEESGLSPQSWCFVYFVCFSWYNFYNLFKNLRGSSVLTHFSYWPWRRGKRGNWLWRRQRPGFWSSITCQGEAFPDTSACAFHTLQTTSKKAFLFLGSHCNFCRMIWIVFGISFCELYNASKFCWFCFWLFLLCCAVFMFCDICNFDGCLLVQLSAALFFGNAVSIIIFRVFYFGAFIHLPDIFKIIHLIGHHIIWW